jgi:selenium-binding protein 1
MRHDLSFSRRRFLAASSAIGMGLVARAAGGAEPASQSPAGQGRTYASPADAMKSPREELAYVVCVYAGTKVNQPDYLATIDLDPASPTYSQVIHRLSMPHVGDELHHFGWNACGSCHGERERRFLIVPGLASSRIHILDTEDPRQPKLHKTIEPAEVLKTGLSAPHTVHCLSDGTIMLSMLGNAEGQGPGGFLLLDEKFQIAGHWEAATTGMQFNYDYWYQPRHNVMVSSEWAAPRTFQAGFKLDDVQAGKYGHKLHFWDWTERKIVQSIDLGADKGMIPLEVRFHHNPESKHGFVGAALSSVMWHWHHANDRWQADPVIEVQPREVSGWPFPVPGLITDLVLSMDDRWLYFSNWLHGDVRQYDVSDPARPKLTGQLQLGGVEGKGPMVADKKLAGGPQMLQLSLDGKRLYVTNSLYSSWDNQFYPPIGEQGSYMLQVDANTESGGLALNEKFHIDFGREPAGPARAHEMRFLRGDSTSDIWP